MYVKIAGARVAQEFVAPNAVMEAVPSPDERIMGDLGHEADVSATVNVTGRGAGPELGVTVSVALVVSVEEVVVAVHVPRSWLTKSQPPGGGVFGGT